MKLVFLDFDGVLNSLEFMRKKAPSATMCTHEDVDRDAVTRLMRIVVEADAHIVVSSSWRKVCTLPELQEILMYHGVPHRRVIGVTPSLSHCRGEEIEFYAKTWSKLGDPLESFVILDDDDDMGKLVHRHVQTSFNYGLRDEHVDEALKILDEPWEPDLEL